jgi:hypothetical protein
MVRKKRAKRRPQDSISTKEMAMHSAQLPSEQPHSPDGADGHRPMRNILKKFGDWAVKKALDYLLVGVVALMTAPAIAIYFYFRSGRAAWTYPWPYAALGFIAACVVIITVSSLLALIRAQRRRTAERAINLEFLSKDKGYLDHAVNQAKAFNTFNSILFAMAREMGEIGNTNRRATSQIKLAQRALVAHPNILAFIGHKIASRTAKKTNKHAAAMEVHLSNVKTTSDLLIESITGYTTWFTANTPEQAQTLISNRTSLEQMVAVMRDSIGSTQGFRDAQKGIYGISQELNTAVNRMVNVIDGVLTFMRDSDVKWKRVIELTDRKLSEWDDTKASTNDGDGLK